VAWKHLYIKSAPDYGTLAFFRNRLNRLAVGKDPKKCVDATTEFFMTVVNGFWLACACEILGISGLNDPVHIPPEVQKGTPSQKLSYIKDIAKKVVDKLTLVNSAFLCGAPETSDGDDHVYNYTRVLCHYGALVAEFRDAWAEGDGERVVRCWKLFLPHFKTAGCSKYALEALRLQIQLKTLSPNLAHQVKWHRFVNTRGGLGKNIPCDLYNEHVNKLIKIIIQNMGPNLTEKSLQRAVRCVSPLSAICKQFDVISHVPATTSAHSTKSDMQDTAKVVSLVLRHNLIKPGGVRCHRAFPKIKHNPLENWNKENMKLWAEVKMVEFGMYNGRFRQEDELPEDDSE